MSDENDLLEPQNSELLDAKDSENEQERSIDVQTLIKEFALDGIVADESWQKYKPNRAILGNYPAWRARWDFRQCVQLGVHYKLPNDPPDVNFGTRFHARFYSLSENKELWAILCEQEKSVAVRQKREPDVPSQTVLRHEDERTFLVDQNIASLWLSGEELPSRSELMTPEGIRRLQGAIRARRFRNAQR